MDGCTTAWNGFGIRLTSAGRRRGSLWHHAPLCRPEGTRMSRLSRCAGTTAILSALALCLCSFTTTTTDPDKAEVVTSDVAHFWQAFDDAAKLPAAQRDRKSTRLNSSHPS